MNDGISLNIKRIIDNVKKRLWVLILITVLFISVSGFMDLFIISPIYEAKTSIIIGKSSNSENSTVQYDEVLLYQKIIRTYSEIAKSRLVAEKTINLMERKISPEYLMDNITVTSQPDTQVMVIKLKGSDPEETANIVNTLASVFIEEAQELLPTGNAKIMDKAIVPQSPLKPNPKLNMIIAFTFGIIISVGLICLLEYMDNTVKTEEDVEVYVELPLLGLIPKQNK